VTVEHFLPGPEVRGDADAEEVRQASSPKRAAEIGRDRRRPLRADWEDVKADVMRRGVLEKFRAHAGLRKLLLSTGDEEIVENAPHDYYWGCGQDGSGRNMLGRILMETRAQLRAEGG
jgi:ribA/ribD-fused uncharacterized protein